MNLTPGALCLYKQKPAILRSTGEKPEILLPDRKSLKVRLKDIVLLHPGPLEDFKDLRREIPEEKIQEIWNLLCDEPAPGFRELTELLCDEYSPRAAWSVFKILNTSPYFKGTPENILVNTREKILEEERKREHRLREESLRSAFIEKLKEAEKTRKEDLPPDFFSPRDRTLWNDLELLVFQKKRLSKILKDLKQESLPENAHRLLLRYGIWPETFDPYPVRFDVTHYLKNEIPLPDLPPEDRLDLTRIPAFAVDDAGTRDPDDALSFEDSALWVHIADVAAVVEPDSPSDILARQRGSNIYLPERTYPMLPSALTAKLGLGLESVSPAFSFRFDLDEHLRIRDFSLHLTTVKVKRLSYDEAQVILDSDSVSPDHPLKKIKETTDVWYRDRLKAGAFVVEMPDVKITVQSRREPPEAALSEAGRQEEEHREKSRQEEEAQEHDNQDDSQEEKTPEPENTEKRVNIQSLPSLGSRRMIAEAMVLTGKMTGLYADKHKIPIPYVSQPLPSSAPSPETDPASMYGNLRLLQRSQTVMSPGFHSGLGLSYYTRVTSPLRRYGDLLVMQQLRAHLKGKKPLSDDEILRRTGEYESLSGSLNYLQRLSNLHWKMVYLLQNPNWRGEGVLVQIQRNLGVFLIPALALETRIPLSRKRALNSIVPLQLLSVDLAGRQASFKISPRDGQDKPQASAPQEPPKGSPP